MTDKLMKGFIAILLTLLMLISGAVQAFASPTDSDNATNEVKAVIDGILSHKLEASGSEAVQNWIDGALSQSAGTASEWYVIALAQYGRYDFTRYEKSLCEYLDGRKIASASTRQKYATALIAVGSDDTYIEATLNDSIGEQGIMSLVFGLHLLNNGCTSLTHSSDGVIGWILEMQCADGGWAISGQYGDVDVTAMTLQALAPHTDNANVNESVDRALTLLSERQLGDGDYSSYGVANPESTAQVIIALSSLGIDALQDERFIKKGNTLLDGIEKYRLNDGSYAHIKGGGANENATSQVFCAMVAYHRFTRGEGALYIFNDTTEDIPPDVNEPIPPEEGEYAPSDPPQSTPNETTRPTTEASEKDADSQSVETNGKPQVSYKLWVSLTIIGVGCVLCLLLYLRGKRHIKSYIAVVVATTVMIVAVCSVNIQSADDYYNSEGAVKDNAIGRVTMTIRCDKAVGISDSEYIPEDGVILDVTEFVLEDGDTVYDILIEAAKKYNIQLENDGSARLAYIAGINYLYEFDHGDLSGWVYLVNGIQPSVGCSEYQLSDGDSIEWHYSLALGNDIK